MIILMKSHLPFICNCLYFQSDGDESGIESDDSSQPSGKRRRFDEVRRDNSKATSIG